jgi:hypothetical protein
LLNAIAGLLVYPNRPVFDHHLLFVKPPLQRVIDLEEFEDM